MELGYSTKMKVMNTIAAIATIFATTTQFIVYGIGSAVTVIWLIAAILWSIKAVESYVNKKALVVTDDEILIRNLLMTRRTPKKGDYEFAYRSMIGSQVLRLTKRFQIPNAYELPLEQIESYIKGENVYKTEWLED